MNTTETVQSTNQTIVLKISEIFYSLQGEGIRAGEPSIFIRLQGCSAKHACFESGVDCDTEFESGKYYTLDNIEEWIEKNANNCDWIVWTGGEPTDQLTDEVVDYFKEKGYRQAIETSGIRQPPKELDHIVLSPKIAEHVILKKWNLINDYHCDELRWVRHKGQDIPNTKIVAKHYYLSPHSDGFLINDENLKHCIDLCLKYPEWKLSLQQHKLWNVL